MSEESVNEVAEEEVEEEVLPEISVLGALKKKADILGLKYHHRIGEEKLAKLIQEHEHQNTVTDTPEVPVAPVEPRRGYKANGRRMTRNEFLRKEAAKLVRVRVACMNPNKKEWEGEIYTVSNSIVGTFKKYVPFNVDEGWHVPQIILNHMQERQCQIFYTVKGPRGNKIRKGRLIKELNIEILPPLTPAELKELGRKQAMAKGND